MTATTGQASLARPPATPTATQVVVAGMVSLAVAMVSAFGTAAVPPFGYQIPSLVCICAMLVSTAGDANGLEPTYWVK